MLIQRKKPGESVARYLDLVQDAGTTDYILDGVVIKDAPVKTIIVTSESDLAGLEGYEPGTVAYTAGFGSMWQLDASGDWQEV